MKMNKITLTIETVNSAFEGREDIEVARILRNFANALENNVIIPSTLLDINGNAVGQVVVE